MQFETLLFERRDQVALVTLNRPERLNALNGALIADLTAAAAAIDADRTIRAAVLTGAGRAFCSGADLLGGGVLGGANSSPGESVRASLTQHFNPMISAWYHLRAPVVVAVNGVAAGAGASLALTGDLVLAARSAVFLQLFAPKLGLMPDLGSTFFLPRLVGTARAKGLALLGWELSADKAADWDSSGRRSMMPCSAHRPPRWRSGSRQAPARRSLGSKPCSTPNRRRRSRKN